MPVVPSPFDSEAFEMPFYRVQGLDGALAREVEALRATLSCLVIDAKVASSDVSSSRLLWSLGFRKVCMQITLRHDLRGVRGASERIVVRNRLDLPDVELQRHAENFTYDRFSLDPRLPDAGVRRLYLNWIRNSLTGGRKSIVHHGNDFCTLSIADRVATIDLVSVLEHGRGIGRALIAAACDLARQREARQLLVTTECENERAWQLYVRLGFLPERFTSVFHLVHQR